MSDPVSPALSAVKVFDNTNLAAVLADQATLEAAQNERLDDHEERLDDHEERLDDHEERIEALEDPPGGG
jgi:tetrahydromethanopterin S-methyltransferase subunit G